MAIICPMCKKAIEPAATPCPRCRADLAILVDFMSNLEEHMNKADAALKAGEVGDAVWAYLNVLETDPDHAVARKQVGKVVTAVRQFDEARRSGRSMLVVYGATLALAVIALAGAAFYAGMQYATNS